MKTLITAILSLIVGGLFGAYLAFNIGLGMGGIGGFVAGAQNGACLAVAAAKDKGAIAAGQADGVIAATVSRIRALAQIPPDRQPKWVVGEADCAALVAEMQRDAAAAR